MEGAKRIAYCGMSVALCVVLLVLGNITFVVYDRLIPRVELLYERRLRKVLFPGRR